MSKTEITIQVEYDYDREVVLRAEKNSKDDNYWKDKYSREVGLFPVKVIAGEHYSETDQSLFPTYIPIDVHNLPTTDTVIDLETEYCIFHIEIYDDEIVSRAEKFEQAYYKNHQQVTTHFLGGK